MAEKITGDIMQKILAIDDKMDNLVTLSALLKNLMPGCSVITAQSGMEGIAKAKAELPDAILLDIIMPDMDGFETCRRLMADESTKRIPVIMITAIKTDPGSRIKGLDIGANAFLSKPIDEVELTSQVKVALRIKKAEDELRSERNSLETTIQERTAALREEITGHKRTVEALRESEERYRRITESLTDYQYTVRIENGRAVETKHSPACEVITGYRAEEFAADPYLWIRMVMPEDHALILERVEQIMEKNDIPPIEHRIKRKDGELRWVSDNIILNRNDSGTLLSYDGVVKDITKHKQAEEETAKLEARFQQAQKMESVGRLAGGVAHDFNNMLGVILGHAEAALDQIAPSDPLHANLEEIRKAARRSADLTRQLLAFARKQVVAPKVLDLNDTVAGMLKMLQRLIGEDINLAWLPGAGLWTVKVDPSQIDQILVNLCVNARDAISGVGKLTIETENGAFDDDYCAAHAGFVAGEYVRLAVSDNGYGMSKETLSLLFEPFFTTKETGKGTGLGLATVYGIVKQNSGFINVYSEPGQGTTFTIYLPRHAGKTEQPRTESVSGSAGRGHETILLAEDEPALLELTAMLLEKEGSTVLAASTPGEAICLAREREHAGEIHLLITDVVMPEMNGRELAKNLLDLYPHMKRLFMSGYTANVIAHHGVLDENVHFIQKPFSRRDLAAKVREALDQK
jgi:PAS domain S-box-containing protein